MKKFLTLLSIFLFLSFNINTITATAQQKIQQAISLEPHSIKHPLKTIRSSDRVVILGKGELIFSY